MICDAAVEPDIRLPPIADQVERDDLESAPMAQFVPNVVTLKDLEALLGVRKQAIQQWIDNGSFPPPAAFLSNGQVWAIDEVEAWAKAANRPSVTFSMKAYLAELRLHEADDREGKRRKAAQRARGLDAAAAVAKRRKPGR